MVRVAGTLLRKIADELNAGIRELLKKRHGRR